MPLCARPHIHFSSIAAQNILICYDLAQRRRHLSRAIVVAVGAEIARVRRQTAEVFTTNGPVCDDAGVSTKNDDDKRHKRPDMNATSQRGDVPVGGIPPTLTAPDREHAWLQSSAGTDRS